MCNAGRRLSTIYRFEVVGDLTYRTNTKETNMQTKGIVKTNAQGEVRNYMHISKETHRLICSLVAPMKPSEHSFTELVELKRTHHNPKPEVEERVGACNDHAKD